MRIFSFSFSFMSLLCTVDIYYNYSIYYNYMFNFSLTVNHDFSVNSQHWTFPISMLLILYRIVLVAHKLWKWIFLSQNLLRLEKQICKIRLLNVQLTVNQIHERRFVIDRLKLVLYSIDRKQICRKIHWTENNLHWSPNMFSEYSLDSWS